MRILLIQTAHAGDALLASSLVADLSERYPLAALDVVVRQGNEALFAHNPRVSRVWAWKKQGSKLQSLLALAAALRAERFDRVYNLQRFASSGFLTWRSGADFKAGFAQNPWSRFFNHRIEHRIPWPAPSGEGQFLHEVQRNRLLLDERLAPPRRPELYPTEQHRKQAQKLAGPGPLVVLAPGSRWYTKQWPLEKWASLMRELPDAFRVVLVGGAEDREAAESLLQAHPNAVNACGQTDANTTGALMDRAWHVFANDSLGIHLASAVNAPSTLVYCSTGPELGFYPLSEAGTYAKAEVECCQKGLHGAKSCKAGHFQCATALEPQALLVPLQSRWQIALHLREGHRVRLAMRQSDGSVRPWILQLATDADAGQAYANIRQAQGMGGTDGTDAAATHAAASGPQRSHRPREQALLWFCDLAALQRQLPDLDPALRRILIAHFRMPFDQRACLRMDGLQDLAEGLYRLPFGLGGSPEWTAMLRCVGVPVVLLPESAFAEGETDADPHLLRLDDAWNGAPPAIPSAQLHWDGSDWREEYAGEGTDNYAPWVKQAKTPKSETTKSE